MKKKGGNQAWLAVMESGQKWSASGNLERAEKKFRLAAGIDPQRMEGWANLGAILLEQDRWREALPTLQRAQALAPGAGVVHLNLAHAWFLAGQDDEALAACRQAIALTPTADALNKLGVILRRSGNLIEAESAFRQALLRNRNHPNALVNVATLLMSTGRFAEAGEAVKTAAGKTLPHDARQELGRAPLLMAEWERLEPVIRETFPRAELDGITHALDATPLELLAVDPVVSPFLESMILKAELVTESPAQRWPLPEDWPRIEAHFSLHKGDTVESYLSACARFEESPAAAEWNAVALYAEAVRLRRNGFLSAGLSPLPDAILRYVHWLMLHDLNDAKCCLGHFKLQPNMVKGTGEKRAMPEHVVGTVRHFYRELLPRVVDAETRAMAVYVMVNKVHCFIDGNGRVARFLINQELEAGGSSPILIPDSMSASLVKALHTVFRTCDIRPFNEEIRNAQTFTRNFLDSLADARARIY